MKIREYIPVIPAGELPNPATYCPANGYILDPTVYVPPSVTFPASNPESIILLCLAEMEQVNFLSLTRTLSSDFRYEIFDSAGVLLNTYTTANPTYSVPKPYVSGYYTIKITLVNPSASFTIFTTGLLSTVNYAIESATFNTPNLTSLSNGFKYCMGIKSVTFNCTLNSLTNMYGLFYCAGIVSFTFPESLPSLTTLESAFYNAPNVMSIIFPWNCNLSVLNTMSIMCAGTTRLKRFHFPQNLPSLVNANQILGSQGNLITDLRLWEYGPLIQPLSHFLHNTYYESGIVTMAPLPACTDLLYAFRYTKVRKLYFTGPSPNLSGVQAMLEFCTTLEEVVFPTEWRATAYSPFGSHVYPFLKKIKCPDKVYKSGTSDSFATVSGNVPVLEEMTGDADNSANTNQTDYSPPNTAASTLKKIWHPKLRVSRFTMVSRMTALTELEFDVENSNWASANSPQISLNAAFSSSWLNTFMSRLITVTGKAMDIGRCDGYMTCDHTIATAKGWNVIGFPKLENGSASGITKSLFTFTGNILFMGGYTSITAGFCYNTAPNPTTSNNPRSVSVSSTGTYTLNSGSLSANTLYYVRAYATNTQGTTYGQEFTVRTLAS